MKKHLLFLLALVFTWGRWRFFGCYMCTEGELSCGLESAVGRLEEDVVKWNLEKATHVDRIG